MAKSNCRGRAYRGRRRFALVQNHDVLGTTGNVYVGMCGRSRVDTHRHAQHRKGIELAACRLTSWSTGHAAAAQTGLPFHCPPGLRCRSVPVTAIVMAHGNQAAVGGSRGQRKAGNRHGLAV